MKFNKKDPQYALLKALIKPIAPAKPIEPKESTVEYDYTEIMSGEEDSMSIYRLMEVIKDYYIENATIVLSAKDNRYECPCCPQDETSTPMLRIRTERLVPNANYKKQLKKYDSDFKKYDAARKLYNAELKDYNKKKKEIKS